MCGIYGHIKKGSGTNSATLCLDGLSRLEYRGYDSAGIAGIEDGKIVSFKAVGKVKNLNTLIQEQKLSLQMAIAHTRWATHGEITEVNAHPHYDENKTIALVHNGIIENYAKIKKKLTKNGAKFITETDTEVISYLISSNYKGDIGLAVKKTLPQLEGSFAIAIIHKDHPGKIVAAARGCPLAIGICKESGDIYISSDSNAFTGKSLDVFYLFEEEYAILSESVIEVFNSAGIKIVKSLESINLESLNLSKGGFEHFLLKEIHEQPISFNHALKDRIDLENGSANFNELSISDDELKKINRILILACGSSYHAGCVAKLVFESTAKIPTEVEIASEFRYRNPIILENTLVIAISQSGETADTLAAVREALKTNSKVIALCNVTRSSISRLATSTLWINAGPEISVCSTKAFTNQLTVLMLFALKIARLHNFSLADGRAFLSHLQSLTKQITYVIGKSSEFMHLATKYSSFKEFFFVGRNYMYPTCLEAALKLKEISYTHATGYPAGEMKHGPIALISNSVATIAFCGNHLTLEKLLSNLMEIKARGGPILAFAPENFKEILSITKDVIFLPNHTSDDFAPIPYSVAGQLFAYYLAKHLGTDIDQPRNLAKSVTVE